jgi:hypothetical protein
MNSLDKESGGLPMVRTHEGIVVVQFEGVNGPHTSDEARLSHFGDGALTALVLNISQ